MCLRWTPRLIYRIGGRVVRGSYKKKTIVGTKQTVFEYGRWTVVATERLLVIPRCSIASVYGA